MPEMDGIELLKVVKAYEPLAQVIITTGFSTIDKTISCLELGANDYILKPFKSNDNVLEVIEQSVKKLERWKEAVKGIIK
jgi:YesN/AraC family two-component response regulator